MIINTLKPFIAGVWLSLASLSVTAEPIFDEIKRAAALGDAEAQNQLGVIFLHGHGITQDYGQAYQWFIRSADQGLSEAMYNLGSLYEHGKGLAVDLSKAENWYMQAAVQHHLDAQFNLASLYLDKKDYQQALDWFKQAALEDHKQSQYALSQIYLYGQGVPRSFVDAYAWLSLAALNNDQAYVDAKNKLGNKLNITQLNQAQQLTSKYWQQIHR